MLCRGLQLDPDLKAIAIPDDIGLSDAVSDPNKELWLFRVPLGFPEKDDQTWRLIPSKKMGIEATFSEHGEEGIADRRTHEASSLFTILLNSTYSSVDSIHS